MATLRNAYADVAELRSYIGMAQSADDNRLVWALNTTSRAIDAACGRRFWLDPYDKDNPLQSRWFQPTDAQNCPVDDIATDTDLVLESCSNDTGVIDTTWDTDDFVLEPVNRTQGGIDGWPYTNIRSTWTAAMFPTWTWRRLLSVKVTARWGWAEVPQAIFQATLIAAADVFKRKDTPFGIAGGLGDLSGLRISGDVLAQANRLIQPFIKMSEVVGIA